MTLPRDRQLPNKIKKSPPRKGKAKSKARAKKKAGGSKFFGGHDGYKGVAKKKVRRLVNGVMREEMGDLRGQARMVKADARQARNQTETTYKRGIGDLNYVHGETSDYLGNLTQQNQNMFSQQGAQQQQAQAALNAMLGDTYSGARSGANEELARLGIQGGGNLQQLNADQAYAQATANQSGANAQSTMGMASGNAQAAMQMLQGMNQGSMMQGIGQNLNARNDAMGEIQTNRINNLNEVRQAMKEAKGSRRDMFFQLLQQLQQTGWDQYMQQQQMGLAKKEFGLNKRLSLAELRLQRKALNKK